MEKIPFTKKEKTAIGDFIHAIQTDTLIVPECENVIDLLFSHNLITQIKKDALSKKLREKSNGFINELQNELGEKVSEEQGREIMKEYYGGI